MIPRRFFWLLDLLVLCVAFLTAYALSPYLYVWLSLAPADVHRLIALPEQTTLPDGIVSFITLMLNAKPVLPPLRDLLWILVSMAPAALLFMEALGGYMPRLLSQTRTRLVVTSLFVPFAGLGLVLLILYALKVPNVSRMFVLSFTALSSLGLAIYRLALRYYFQRRLANGYYAKNVALIGRQACVEWMIHYFAVNVSPAEYRLLGYLCVESEETLSKPAVASLPELGKVEDLDQLLVQQPIQEVIAIQAGAEGDWLKKVIEACDYFRVTLRIVPEVLLFNEMRELKLRHYRNVILNLPAVVLTPVHLESDLLFAKRLFDLFVSGAALVLLSPLFLLIALAIKITTPHLPVMYPWRVVGRNGVEFTGYKFTTMVADADERKASLLPQNEMNGPVFKIKNDPRVTPLGRFLRKYSLNELPQLWSVLKGDMSLVGPRPAFRYELQGYELWQKRKLSVRPGLTCLWQIRGRNTISDFNDWVRMDLEYIDHWSLWLDVRILVRTFWAVIAGTGS